jgi:hypothetical protein
MLIIYYFNTITVLKNSFKTCDKQLKSSLKGLKINIL